MAVTYITEISLHVMLSNQKHITNSTLDNISSSWLAEKGVRGSIPNLTAMSSDIGYLLLRSRDMAEISLKRRKSSNQPTIQFIQISLEYCNRRIPTSSSRLYLGTLF